MGFQETFRALADPTRREILRILRDGAKSAGEIGSHFAMTGATISHHLSVLREAGVPQEQIQVTDLCTRCNPRYLFSHRAMGEKRGNLAAFMCLRPQNGPAY